MNVAERYRTVFKEFTHFNFVQSKVLDDVGDCIWHLDDVKTLP